ncbi:ImmA/IrrE family metallo-endopeptidase [Alicyclobacillus tolerans]|uniref:ImmA/IrrE family metallo-endopeptidase n=1 Tax=Alicyclobacillus tolerans TaxID=90970 RepID=UPI001F44F13E|nr:ImmA/IrrE family metallo-endopeptidase [Alicyclobacillus tolerans]MCF8566869.1 ImmA/IrrE family metallo-endopeptidase [Alicyclobacillus tolerans]
MDKVIRHLIRKYKTNCPFELASYLNITVWFRDLGSGTRGLYMRKLRRRYIVIHEELNEQWQRFICAHELAHDRLHPGLSRFWLDEQSFRNAGKFERQANKFAIRLLTAGDSPQRGETIVDFLIRKDVPEEMSKFFM